MKLLKKLMVVFVALFMVMSMTNTVMASEAPGDEPTVEPTTETVTITITRDSTYKGDPAAAGRAYSYYKIFSATYGTDFDGTAFAGGYEAGGAPVTEQGDGKVSYLATAAVAAKLADAGNAWFDVQTASGSEYSVITWKEGVQPSAENVQDAAAWLIENGAYEEGPTALTFADGKWTAEVTKGYYVIKGDTGANLVAATTNIDIKEKNDYPPLDKTEADEDTKTQSDTERNVAVGDVLTYNVKVTIPATAAVGNTIEVWDKPSAGLTYNNDVVVKENTGNATVAPRTAGEGEAWRQVITVTEGSQGKDVIFEFTMTVNEGAVVDTGRINTSQLKYGNEYESLPDSVTFTTHFTGIQKTDGQEPLKGVEFTLKENGTEFKVSKPEGKDYYIPDANGSSTVVTDDYGLIKIRGLDKDKAYTLTETKTLPGFNMLEEDVSLVLTKDKDGAYEATTAASWTKVINESGTVLPSTGGIGTTIFHVVGAALVLGAGVLLVAKKRVNG